MKYLVSLFIVLSFNQQLIGQDNMIHIQLDRKELGGVTGDFIVEDEQGRRTGWDHMTNTKLREIPNVHYGQEGLDGHEGGPGVSWVEWFMPFAIRGTYKITVIGTGSDSCILDIEMGQFGPGSTIFNFDIFTSPGQIIEYEIFYDPDTTVTLTAKLIIDIDIKPDDDPNSINPNSQGVIPVAVLTDPDFDAATVDVSTVVFGLAGAQPVHNGHIEDVDGDGDDDLMLHFNTQDTGIQCGDTEATLSGKTIGGEAIEGSDSINTVGCK